MLLVLSIVSQIIYRIKIVLWLWLNCLLCIFLLVLFIVCIKRILKTLSVITAVKVDELKQKQVRISSTSSTPFIQFIPASPLSSKFPYNPPSTEFLLSPGRVSILLCSPSPFVNSDPLVNIPLMISSLLSCTFFLTPPHISPTVNLCYSWFIKKYYVLYVLIFLDEAQIECF